MNNRIADIVKELLVLGHTREDQRQELHETETKITDLQAELESLAKPEPKPAALPKSPDTRNLYVPATSMSADQVTQLAKDLGLKVIKTTNRLHWRVENAAGEKVAQVANLVELAELLEERRKSA